MWDGRDQRRSGGQDYALPFETAHFLDGFETPDRQFHFKPDWAQLRRRGREMPGCPTTST